MLIGYILLFLIISIIPCVIGLPWLVNDIAKGKISKIAYSYVMGFFSMLSIFEIVFFFSAMFTITLKTAVVIYSILLLIMLLLSGLYTKKKGIIQDILSTEESKWTKYDVIYLVIFLGLLAYQVYYAVFYSRTYMADDGYVAMSAAAISDNYINMTKMYTGEYIKHNSQWIQRTIQSFNYVPAYLSSISGVNSAIIAHTILYFLIVVVAYMVYAVMADQLFDKRDNKLIFLCFIAVAFIWGYHSHYSLTFRLLGPNDSGKAVLAVVLAPFMLVLMHKIIEDGFRRALGLQIFVLSISACALTLGGIYTFASLLVATVLFSGIKKKSAKVLLYLLCGGIVPSLFALVFLYYFK